MNLINSGIYKIINLITNDFYIGSTINFKSRFKSHKRKLNLNKHHSPILQNSWNKYGEDKFLFEIIETIKDKNKLIKREQYYINLLKPKFNCSLIAGSPLGVKRSEKTKALLRKITLEQFKRNGHPCKGKKFSLEARKNLSESHKGKSLNHKSDCICGICKTKRGESCGINSPRYVKREVRDCKCGCGFKKEVLINSCWKFKSGHNGSRRGQNKSKKEIEKQRLSLLNYYKRKRLEVKDE